MYKILTLNLGATSTKASIYQDEALLTEEVIRHSDEELRQVPTQRQQLDYRKKMVLDWFAGCGVSVEEIDAVVIRTAAARKCKESGTYQINQALRDDLYKTYLPDEEPRHVSSMVLPLADALLDGHEVPIYLVDSTYVDEYTDVARISGHPELPRFSTFHALNQKAVARAAAAELGKTYQESRLVVAHLGGGVSIGAHENGRVIDTSNGGTGQDGPFSPNRTGVLPLGPLVDLCFSGKYTHKEITSMVLTKGGFAAYTGCTDVRTVEQMAGEGDANAELVLQAFSYQVAKEIAAQSAVLCFDVDAVVLTGGLANSKRIVADIKQRVEKIAPVLVYPGEEEGPAMVAGALRVLRGEEEALCFESELVSQNIN